MHLRYGHPGRRACAAAAAGLCALALVGGVRAARAEEIAIFAGATDTDDHTSVSYSWQLEYRQPLRDYLDFSLAYLNEGHVPGHHRDGASAQIWAVTPRLAGHFDLALGIGPYFYFDTQAAGAVPGFRDYHGVGAIVSGSASYYFDSSWFIRLNLSDVHTPAMRTRAPWCWGSAPASTRCCSDSGRSD